jgi:hypothetical protein
MSGPTVYEVNIDVDVDVADEFLAWLKPHASELLACKPCRFTSAEIFTREPPEALATRKCFTVLYRLEDRAGLQEYLDVYAAKLRGDGAQRFAGKMSITRQILQSTAILQI